MREWSAWHAGGARDASPGGGVDGDRYDNMSVRYCALSLIIMIHSERCGITEGERYREEKG